MSTALVHRLPDGTPVGVWTYRKSLEHYYLDPGYLSYGNSVVADRVASQKEWEALAEDLPYSSSLVVRWTAQEISDDDVLSDVLTTGGK